MSDPLPPPGWFVRPESWPYWMPNTLMPRVPLSSAFPSPSGDLWNQNDATASPTDVPQGAGRGILGHLSPPASSQPADPWSREPGPLVPDWLASPNPLSQPSAPTSVPSNKSWYENSPAWVRAAMPLGSRVENSVAPAEPAYQPWADPSADGRAASAWDRPPPVPGTPQASGPTLPVPGPNGWHYPGAQLDPTPPARPKDIRTRTYEALSNDNVRYYLGPGFYDALEKFAPLAQFVPGSGAVQSMEEGAHAGKEFEAGNYGKAAARFGQGAAEAGFDFLPGAKIMTALLAGPLARFFPHANVPVAEMMEKAGRSADEIWRATGLGRGADGHWRFEISDKGYRIDPKAGALNERGFRDAPFFDQQVHQNLRENYPVLADARSQLLIDPRVKGEGRGLFDSTGPGSIQVEAPTKGLARWKSIHEIQHFIDYLEKFAAGGGLLEFNPGLSLQKAYEAYLKLAGEVAARNAQWRLFMTPKERLKKSPLTTELEMEHPVPRDQQIVRYSHYDD